MRLSKTREVWFENVDATFWQFSSKRSELIQRVTAHLAQRADTQIEQIELGS